MTNTKKTATKRYAELSRRISSLMESISTDLNETGVDCRKANWGDVGDLASIESMLQEVHAYINEPRDVKCPRCSKVIPSGEPCNSWFCTSKS